jgi:hypothetical protein
MRISVLLPRALRLALVSLLAVGTSGCLGCGGETELAESALRRAFPDQAAEVLERGAPLDANEGEFTRRTSLDSEQSVFSIGLPRDGAGVIRFHLPGGAEIQVREIGVAGEGMLVGRAVSYRRAGGTSFWTAVPGGVEEWLHLDAGVARADEVVAAWEIQGASPRQSGDAILLVDDAGSPRMQVIAPKAYKTGGHEVEARLAVRGARIELSVDADGSATLVDPAWTAAGVMGTARDAVAATLLQNGKVLVAGGAGIAVSLKSTELYDPATNLWTFAAPMTFARAYSTATRLGNGKVLVAGGSDGSNTLASAELYDPGINTWVDVASMITARQLAAATLLGNGKVLVVGGFSVSGDIASAELYDPGMNTWTTVASMVTPRQLPTATLLGNGKVLAMGGFNAAGTVGSAELYDAATNSWSPAGTPGTARQLHTATLLGSGKVLVAGGHSGLSLLASAELYDAGTNSWSPTGTLIKARQLQSATLLGNGLVLVAGGDNGSGQPVAGPSAELYDPATGTWTPTAALTFARYFQTATLLGNGKTLIAGGENASGYVANSELYSLDADGTSCSSSAAFLCQSGFCIDGVCCNNACTGTCSACSKARKGTGTDGACGPISAGLDPDNECTDLGAASCQTTGVCDGAGACQRYPDQTPCDDGNTCTLGDACRSGACQSGAPVVCPDPPICQKSTCYPATGACVIYNNDGADCPGGKCFAGGCLILSSSGSSSAGASSSASASASGSGSGSGAATSAGSGEAMASSSASGSGAGGAAANSSASGAGAGVSRGDLRLHGGCGVSRAPASAAPWLLLGLLLAARRQGAHSQRRNLIPRNRRDT